jgi:hypothetical protein
VQACEADKAEEVLQSGLFLPILEKSKWDHSRPSPSNSIMKRSQKSLFLIAGSEGLMSTSDDAVVKSTIAYEHMRWMLRQGTGEISWSVAI